jgi:hypothetical protein
MRYEKCNRCGDYNFNECECQCKKYRIYHEDYLDENGHDIFASSFNDAAKKYGEYYNQDDGRLLDGLIEIEIEDSEGVRKKFDVSAEPDIYYNITERR